MVPSPEELPAHRIVDTVWAQWLTVYYFAARSVSFPLPTTGSPAARRAHRNSQSMHINAPLFVSSRTGRTQRSRRFIDGDAPLWATPMGRPVQASLFNRRSPSPSIQNAPAFQGPETGRDIP